MDKTYYALVITPHPDDAELGIGGTVAGWTKSGREVVYIVCTNGDKGTDDMETPPEMLAKTREEEQLAAARILGVNEVQFLRHPDQGLEDTHEFRKQIVRFIRSYRPEIVATTDLSSPNIIHRDHRITGQVVLDAVYPFARNRPAYPDLIREGLEPHLVPEILLWATSNPNYYVNITQTYEQKMTALRCHSSQVINFFREGEEFFRERHEEMAAGKGYQLAEAFRRIIMTW